MGLAWLVVTAVTAVLASWAFNALVYLVWPPYAITRRLRAQGVRGPGYRFFVGNLAEIKRLRSDAAGVTLDLDDHDFIPMAQPHFRKWIQLYSKTLATYDSRSSLCTAVLCSFVCYDSSVCAGQTFVDWTGARPNVCMADVNVVKQVLSDHTGLYPKKETNPRTSPASSARASCSPTATNGSATARSCTQPSTWTRSRYIFS
jgi:cytochrome P450 family 709